MTTLNETLLALQLNMRDYKEREPKLTEADTIRILILPVLHALGWNIHNPDEMLSEYRHTKSDNPVDCALFLQKRVPTLFVEAKALGTDLNDHKYITQAVNYANTAGVKWCVLSDGDEWRVYNAHAEVEVKKKLFFSFKISSAEMSLTSKEHFLLLISRDGMINKDIDERWNEFHLDCKIKPILENLSTDRAFIDLISRRVGIVNPDEIIASLRRARLQHFYSDAIIDRIDPISDFSVNIRNEIITGDSVSDLYKKTIEHLIANNLINDSIIPFSTGKRRYLISKSPIHPNQTPFTNKKQIGDYYVECNKSRASAPQDMQKFIDALLNQS